jgi:hypothetical protein
VAFLLIIFLKKYMKKISTLFLLFFGIANSFGQDLLWNGNANTDFFNESNWQYISTGLAPNAGVINPGNAINLSLQITNAAVAIIASGQINLGSGSLSLTNATVTANTISGGTITINERGYLDLNNSNSLLNNINIALNSGIGWVKTKLITPSVVQSSHLSRITVNSAAAVYTTNIRLDNYYFGGTVIRSSVASTSPVTLYDRVNLAGTSVSLAIDVIHSGNSITNMNNKTSSFVLRKGFMLTIADEENGTGKSKNYIASEQDLTVNELPTNLKDNISFARVVPWNWVSKKGIGGDVTGLDNTWFYRWANNGLATIDFENAPMAWGASAADDDADITIYKQKYKATHVMGFNEPDDCNSQSGQYRDLCQEDVAVGYYKNLMKSGLRIVSPAGREEAPAGWLQNFYDKATVQDIRIDVIGVHWYDWGSNPVANPNHTATVIFNRFKTYLTNVYNRFGKPIWITEFNANPNRSNATNLAFMQLALPYLETLDYVERYAWFEPVSNVADYYDGSNNLTNVGTYYKNFSSSPSIPETTITDDNNLDTYYSQNIALDHNIVTNGNFETNDSRAWIGTNSQVVTDTSNSNIVNPNTEPDIIRSIPVGNINNGVGTMHQVLEVSPNVSYTVTFDYKWVSGTGNYVHTARVYRDLASTTTIGSVVLGTTPNVWYRATINFTAPTNVFKARLFFDKLTGNRPLRIHNVKVRLNPNKTWNGNVNNDWNTAGNWVENAVPLTTDVVFIPRGLTNYPTLSTDITTARLFIDAGASFISSAAVVGSETYFLDLPDNKWHLLTPPVDNINNAMSSNWVAAAGIATGQGSNIAIGSYNNLVNDPTTGPWRYFTGTATTFDNGKGYSMKKLSKGMFIFSGNTSAFPKTINITQGAASHWNLIGNPATSYLDVNQFLTTNTTPLKDAFEAVFVWNAATENYDAMTSGFIHPGQAFFVNSNVASTSVTVTNAMLSHQRNINFYKSASVQTPQIVLNIFDGTITKETEINYIEGKTTGLDPRFDIGLFDGVASDFSLFTHLVTNNEGIPLMLQALPNTNFENMIIPIGIKAAAGKELTFSLNATDFPEGIFVFLEDRLNSTITRLDQANASYKITLSEMINNTGRFFLHTRNSSVLNTENLDLSTISIYKTAYSTLKITGLSSGNTTIQLVNILGKQVLNTNFEAAPTNEITLPRVATGVYFVKLKFEKGSITKKIVLE